MIMDFYILARGEAHCAFICPAERCDAVVADREANFGNRQILGQQKFVCPVDAQFFKINGEIFAHMLFDERGKVAFRHPELDG